MNIEIINEVCQRVVKLYKEKGYLVSPDRHSMEMALIEYEKVTKRK